MPDFGSLTTFDWILIAILIASTIKGAFKGFSREVFSLIAFIIALYMTAHFGSLADEPMSRVVDNPVAARIGGRLLVFMLFSMAFAFIGMMLGDLLRKTMSNAIDRSLGLLFGFLRGALVIMVPFVLLDYFVAHDAFPRWLTESHSYPFLETGAEIAEKHLPQRDGDKLTAGDFHNWENQAQEKALDLKDDLKTDAADVKETVEDKAADVKTRVTDKTDATAQHLKKHLHESNK